MSETIERPPAPAKPPARQDARPLSQVTRVAELFTNSDFIARMNKAVSGQVNTSLMMSALAGSLRRSPQLAECSVADVAGKALLLAQAGLPPDTVLAASHLIPFKEKVWNAATRKQEERFVCQMVIGYHGLLELAYRSGKVDYVTGRVAWRDELEGRQFEFQLGTEEWLKHIPQGRQHDTSPEAQANGTAEFPTHAYAIAHLAGGRSRPFEVWPMSKVLAIRDSTAAYGFARYLLNQARQNSSRIPAGYSKTPWVAHMEKMAAKTMVRQLCSWLPRSMELATLSALDEAQERRSIDLGPIIDSTDYVAAAADAAEMSGDPGAAFGMRGDGSEEELYPHAHEEQPQQAPAPAQRRQERAPRQTKTQAPPPPPAAEAPAETEPADASHLPPPREDADLGSQTPAAPPPTPAQPAPTFDQWLLNEDGEPAGDEPITNPLAFAKALETLWAASSAKERLLQENADAIQEARAADQIAANILDSLEAPPPIMVPLRTGRDGPVWAEYIREFKAEVAMQTAAGFPDFYGANRSNILKAPPSSLSLIIKAVAERCKALGLAVPEELAKGLQAAATKPAAPPAAAAPTGTPQDVKDRQQADNILAELARITEPNGVALYTKRDAVRVPRERWIAEGKTALTKEIEDACNRRYLELGGKMPA